MLSNTTEICQLGIQIITVCMSFYLELIINAIVLNKNVDWSRIGIYNSKFPIFIRKLGVRIPNIYI